MSGTKNDQCMKGWYEIRGEVLPSAITSISIRLDPNPLRNWNRGKIEERLHNWRLLADQMCEFPENSKIILDPDMLS
uniref:Uncharacterized protein n=1 Tax=Caenorhabditis japonica TaxID=281687 RepID=A0A8R1HII4_CAEJA